MLSSDNCSQCWGNELRGWVRRSCTWCQSLQKVRQAFCWTECLCAQWCAKQIARVAGWRAAAWTTRVLSIPWMCTGRSHKNCVWEGVTNSMRKSCGDQGKQTHVHGRKERKGGENGMMEWWRGRHRKTQVYFLFWWRLTLHASVNLTISRRNLEAITASNESNITKIIALIKIIELNTCLLQKEVPFPLPYSKVWNAFLQGWCQDVSRNVGGHGDIMVWETVMGKAHKLYEIYCNFSPFRFSHCLNCNHKTVLKIALQV